MMPFEFRFHTVAVNGIDMNIAEYGHGPLVLLCHGWPEIWYSWRHQLVALAAVGYRVVAPDMRGFGRSSAPEDVAAYTILHNVGDMVALVAALGAKRAVIVGHDWGAPAAWHAALMRPDVFPAIVAMSVPHRRRGAMPPLEMLRKAGKSDYYYLYFQEQAAEDEFARDPAFTLRCLFHIGFGETPRAEKMSLYVDRARGFLGPPRDIPLPPWLTESDMAVFADEYRRSGFRGGLNWYRNIDRNWELTAPWQGATVTPPAAYMVGDRDVVYHFPGGKELIANLIRYVHNLKQNVVLQGCGHWIQQERATEVNQALLTFLRE